MTHDIDIINKQIKKVTIKNLSLTESWNDEQLKSEYSNFPYDHDPLDDKNIAWTPVVKNTIDDDPAAGGANTQ